MPGRESFILTLILIIRIGGLKEAETLERMVNHMCTTRLAEIEALYWTILDQKLEEHSAEMYDLAFGVVNMNSAFMQQVSQIEDKLLQ